MAENCEANIIVVENNQQLQKILKVRPELPHLKAIIQYTGEVAVREPNFIYSVSSFAWIKPGVLLHLNEGQLIF